MPCSGCGDNLGGLGSFGGGSSFGGGNSIGGAGAADFHRATRSSPG
jgi:hypothetical protein